MNQKPTKGWFKHADFIILDLIMMQVSFALAYWLIHGRFENPYVGDSYSYLAVVFAFSQIAAALFSRNYSGILRRGYYKEIISIVQYEIVVAVIALLFLFAAHQSTTVSRLQFGFTLVFFLLIAYVARSLNKWRLHNSSSSNEKNKTLKSLVVITSGKLADEAYERITNRSMPRNFFISGCIILDGDKKAVKGDYDFPVLSLNKTSLRRLREKWVDEVVVVQPSDRLIDKDLFDTLFEMGIAVSFTLAMINEDDWPPVHMSSLGEYKVITSSIKPITARDAFLKRTMDIFGAIAGCLITCILFIFVAPAIYIKSPGPILFKQKRVGLNGRVFDMYKFRSMYMDAEERKAELMQYNKADNDLLFKMDDDPRIIGSEKKDRNGKPKGIGNIIRDTSIELCAIIGLNKANPVFARVSPVKSISACRRFTAPNGAIMPI